MIRFCRTLAVLALVLPGLCANEAATQSAVSDGGGLNAIWGVIGALFALVLGFIQLVVGLSIAAYAITKGLNVLSRLLGDIDIWAEVKKRNPAVALLAAGVLISYCMVIGSGIESMTIALRVLGSDWFAGLVGLVAGLINLWIAIMVASFAITVVFKVMDKLTTTIDEKAEFLGGNVAIGIVYCGTIIGVSGLVASGVKGIGSGVGMLISSLIHLVAG